MRHIRGVHLKSFLKHQIPLLRLASVLMDRGLHIASKKNWTMILIHGVGYSFVLKSYPTAKVIIAIKPILQIYLITK